MKGLHTYFQSLYNKPILKGDNYTTTNKNINTILVVINQVLR